MTKPSYLFSAKKPSFKPYTNFEQVYQTHLSDDLVNSPVILHMSCYIRVHEKGPTETRSLGGWEVVQEVISQTSSHYSQPCISVQSLEVMENQ